MTKPILCVDFDGVIHNYLKGWQDGTIHGDVTPGFFEWAHKANQHFRLQIYSSRSKTQEGRASMGRWLFDQIKKWIINTNASTISEICVIGHVQNIVNNFEFVSEKPHAFLTIDDRAMQFRGDWSVDWLDPERLREFKPWNGT